MRSRVTRGAAGALSRTRPVAYWNSAGPRERRMIVAAAQLLAVVLALTLWSLSWGVLLAVAFAFWWVPRGSVGLEVRGKRRLVRPISIVLPLGLLVICVTYPFYFGKLGSIPIFGDFPNMNTAVIMLIFTVMALGLNMVVGYAGLLDLGYVAFYAIGAYMTAWFASYQFSQHTIHIGSVGIAHDTPGFHFSIWLILVMAAIATALAGVLIGLPTLRLRGDYLAIVTLGFGEIIPQVARNGDNLLGTGFNLTGGVNGVSSLDSPGFGNTIHHYTRLPASFLASPNSVRLFFWTALVLLLFTIFCSWRLRDSKLGRAWVAIREDETAAAAMGVPLMQTKTWAYAAGAFFGGIAGAFYASFVGAAIPDDFFFNISVFILCMVILGGMGNIWGVILGACFLAWLDRQGLATTGAWINSHLGTHLDVPKYEFGIFGLILVVVMLFRPQGLIGSRRRQAEFEEGVHDQPLYDVTH